MLTVMLDVVAPVLHSNAPAALVDRVDDPQLSTTFTTGAGGISLGDAISLPGELVQPSTVVATV